MCISDYSPLIWGSARFIFDLLNAAGCFLGLLFVVLVHSVVKIARSIFAAHFDVEYWKWIYVYKSDNQMLCQVIDGTDLSMTEGRRGEC